MDDPATPDPELKAPLARFQGEHPPTPAWFDQAIARRPDRTWIEVQGAPIELLTWGERGRPGLLFIHGGRAHADWWSFIAPFFAADWRVAAFSLSGMGRSGWRPSYSAESYAAEAMDSATAAGLFEAAVAPVVVGHSFGGWISMYLASQAGARLKAAVILDSGLRAGRGPSADGPLARRPVRVYPTLEAALARFRLMPSQTCDNAYLLDYIARESLKRAPLPDSDSGEEGWTWRFDPAMGEAMAPGFFAKIDRALASPNCPLALMWGERSRIVTPEVLDYTLARIPPGTPQAIIPDAAHHLFLDQPLAVVAALRSLLSAWPR